MKSSFLALTLVGFASQALYSQTPDNPVLTRVAAEDVASRTGGKIAGTDEDRIRIVLQQLAEDAARTPADKAHAALVLQHSPLEFKGDSLVATFPGNYLLAHHLATQAYEAGYENARYLVAQTIDRFMTFTIGRQKYGTNRLINQKTGVEELVPIDRSVSDDERRRYGVAPLADLLKQYPERGVKKPD